MSEKLKIPSIIINDAFAPVEEHGVLHSPNLGPVMHELDHFQGEMWQEFLEQPQDSIEEIKKARRLATYYLIKTANKLQDMPSNRDIWVERFNAAAEEKYGEVDGQEALGIIAADAKDWADLTSPTRASILYNELIGKGDAEQLADNPDLKILESLKEPLLTYIPEITETVINIEDGPYDMPRSRDIFQQMLSKLAERDSKWGEWKITNKQHKTMLSTSESKAEIDIPDGRGSFESKDEILGTSFHELGVHAWRVVNGIKISETASKGLPDKYEFEEGVGTIFAYIATGKLSHTARDRYVDIALASGKINGVRLSRDEIIELGISRNETRARAMGEPTPDEEKSRDKVTKQANRIFRGGDAVPIYEGGKIVDQAVNPIDSQYYDGFKRASKYIADKIRSGVTPKELFDFLLCGGHDPTNPDHIKYLQEHGVKVI